MLIFSSRRRGLCEYSFSQSPQRFQTPILLLHVALTAPLVMIYYLGQKEKWKRGAEMHGLAATEKELHKKFLR